MTRASQKKPSRGREILGSPASQKKINVATSRELARIWAENNLKSASSNSGSKMVQQKRIPNNNVNIGQKCNYGIAYSRAKAKEWAIRQGYDLNDLEDASNAEDVDNGDASFVEFVSESFDDFRSRSPLQLQSKSRGTILGQPTAKKWTLDQILAAVVLALAIIGVQSIISTFK